MRTIIATIAITATAMLWVIYLIEHNLLTQGVNLIKAQEVRYLGIASGLALLVSTLLILAPKLMQAGASAATASAGPQQPEGEPPIVTPKRVSSRKLELQDRILEDAGQVLSLGLEVRHLMSEHLESVHPDTKLADVKRIMSEKGIRHLAVTKPGEYGHLAGIISDRDVVGRRGGYARDIMTPNPISICHGAKVQEAVDVMADRGFSCLPVRRGEIICGIITTTDLIIGLRATYEMLRTLVPDEEFAHVGGFDEFVE